MADAKSKREPAGQVWLDLCRRYLDAALSGDAGKQAELEPVIRALEALYPDAIETEKRLWGCAGSGL